MNDTVEQDLRDLRKALREVKRRAFFCAGQEILETEVYELSNMGERVTGFIVEVNNILNKLKDKEADADA